MTNSKTRHITSAALAGACYAAVTVCLAPISFGPLQCRVSEAMCVLPFFAPSLAYGLFAGCFAANLITGNIYDIIFGSLATLAAGLCTAAVGKACRKDGGAVVRPTVRRAAAACLAPVVFNALIIGAVITGAYCGLSIFDHPEAFFMYALEVGAGEAAVMYAIGLPLLLWLPGKAFFRDFIYKLQ